MRRRRWPRRLGYAALALLLLVVALRLALPTLIERGVAWAAPRYLGLPAHLENVDLALLRGQVVLEGLVVGSHPASTLGGRRLPAAPAGGDVPTAVQEEPAEARVEEQEVAAQEQEVEAQEAPPAPAPADDAAPDAEATPGDVAAPAAEPVPPAEDAAPSPAPDVATEGPPADDPVPADRDVSADRAEPDEPAVPAVPAEPAMSPQPAPDDVLVQWQRVRVDVDYVPLFERRIRLRELVIEGPSARLERLADGRIDPLAAAEPTHGPLAPGAEEPEEPEPEEAPGEPWTVALDHFAVRAPDVRLVDVAGGDPLVAFSLESFTLDDLLLAEERVGLGAIAIAGPSLSVRRDFVMAQAGGEPAPEPPPAAPAPAEPGEPPDLARYRLDAIDLESGRFEWITERGPVHVALALEARDVTLVEGERFPVRLALELDDGRLELSGEVGAVPPAFDGKLVWERLPVPVLALAAAPDVAGWLRSCRASGDLEVSVRVAGDGEQAPGARVSGRASLESLALADPEGGEQVAVAWERLAVDAREIRVPFAVDGAAAEPIRVALERVELVAPDALYTLPSPALDALLGTPPATDATAAGAESAAAEAEAAEAAPEAPAPDTDETPPQGPAAVEVEPAPAAAGPGIALTLGALDVRGAALRYADRRAAGPMQAQIEGLDLALGETRADVADATVATVGSLVLGVGAIRWEDASRAAPMRAEIDALAVDAKDVGVEAAESPAARLGALAVKSDAIRFVDEAVEPDYRGELKAFSLEASALAWPGPQARQVAVQGRSADGGSFSLRGSLGADTGEAVLAVEELALAPFNPYATSAAGYALGGKASLDTKLRIRNGRYETNNDLVLQRLEVSSQRPGDFEERFGVPLDLALALLRDPAGNITLSIPVAVDERGASAGIGTVIAGAIRQALVGALTAPLKLLGAGFSALTGGGGGSGVEDLPSPPGQATLADGSEETLGGLAELLASRPSLAVRLTGRTGEVDRDPVAVQILAERLERGEGLPEIEGVGLTDFFARRRVTGAIESRARGEEVELEAEDQALFERYVRAVEVPPERLAALARARAEAARDALLTAHGVAPERIDVAGTPAPSGDPGVVIALEARATDGQP